MTEDTDLNEFQSTKPWVGTFLNLDKPRTVSESVHEKAKFSANFEIDADDPEVGRLRAAIVRCACEKWPALDIGAAIKDGKLNVPFQNGDRLADRAVKNNENPGNKNYKKNRLREWSRGKMVLTARSEFLPPITIQENGNVVALEDMEAVGRLRNKFFYSGVGVFFAVKLNAYEGVGATGLPGVNAYLRAVESTGKGTPLIARRDPAERFREYRGLASEEDPTGGAGDTDW